MPRTKGAKTYKPDEVRLPIISEFALWLMDKPFPWYRLGDLLSRWEINRIARQCGKEMIRDLMRIYAQD